MPPSFNSVHRSGHQLDMFIFSKWDQFTNTIPCFHIKTVTEPLNSLSRIKSSIFNLNVEDPLWSDSCHSVKQLLYSGSLHLMCRTVKIIETQHFSPTNMKCFLIKESALTATEIL